MNVDYPHQGMNRRDLDRILLALGGTVELVRRTGDLLYRHPHSSRVVRINARRKDATREAVCFVQDVYRSVIKVA